MVTHRVSSPVEINDTERKDLTMDSKGLATQDDRKNLPAHMRSETPEGLDNVARYQSRQRLKIIQPTTQIELVDTFGVGSVITTPGNILVAKKGEDFTATTLGFYASAQRCADYNDKAIEDKFEEVFNPAHPYFAKAENRKNRYEKYGPNGEFRREYVLALNYALQIRGGDLDSEHVRLIYSRGNAQIGRNLNGLIKRRGLDGVSVYGNTFKFHTILETNGNNSWFTMNYTHIPDWEETKEMYAKLADMHAELMDGYNALLGSEPPAAPENNIPIEVEV